MAQIEKMNDRSNQVYFRNKKFPKIEDSINIKNITDKLTFNQIAIFYRTNELLLKFWLLYTNVFDKYPSPYILPIKVKQKFVHEFLKKSNKALYLRRSNALD